jgi:hypothetical protein
MAGKGKISVPENISLILFLPCGVFLSCDISFRTVKQMSLVMSLNGKYYAVGYVSTPETFPTYLQTAQDMIDSFQVIRGGG